MAHLLRGKQAGIQKDLSAGITPEFFAVDNVRQPCSTLVHSYVCVSPMPADTLDYSLPVMASTLKYPP
jgi:hypothetical protein